MRGRRHELRAWWERRVAPTPPARAAGRFFEHQMTDRAATLTYYAMLSLFPGLLIVMTLLGLVGGERLVEEIVAVAESRGAGASTAQVVETVARRALSTSGAALSVTLVLSLVVAVNAASGVLGAAGRAVNAANGIEDERGVVRRRLLTYAVTGLLVLLLILALVLLVAGGGLMHDVFDIVGLGPTAADLYDIVRWPAALVLAVVAVAAVLRFTPHPAARRRRFLTAGAIVTVALWIVASAGFSFYVANFARYNLVYGAFSTAVVLLIWLYLLAAAFLYGAELDAELRRRRAARAAAAG